MFVCIAGTMQTLDARHYELFLYDKWIASEWNYEEVSSHEIPFHCHRASGAILDATCVGGKEVAGQYTVARLRPHELIKQCPRLLANSIQGILF